MSNYTNLEDMLSAAATQIQLKTGSTEKIKGDDIPDAIKERLEGRLPMTTVQPSFLQAGDKVAIVAGSSAGTDAMVTAAQSLFTEWGLTTTLDYYAAPTEDYVATAIRIIGALQDNSVKAIIALRGGFGSGHVLPYIPHDVIANNPKWFIGYSDVCGYLCECINAGVQVIHGPMCSSIVNHPNDDGSLDKLHDILFGSNGYNSLTFADGSGNNVIGKATGRLVGGNSGTIRIYYDGDNSAFQFNDDLIVVFEETTTSAYPDGNPTWEYWNRLQELKYACGNRIKALIIGDYPLTTSSQLSGDKYSIAKSVFWDIPICFTSNIGHGDVNWPIVLGSVATLNVSSTSNATLTFCETPTSVNYALTNVEILYGQKIAAIGAPFTARLAATGSCSFSSVTIMMNNIDVTSSAWTASTGVVSIASVTGDITITASADNALPSGYTAVEYITCSGAQWFDSGFKGSRAMGFDVTAMATDNSSYTNYGIFGGRTSSTSKRFDASIGYVTDQTKLGNIYFGIDTGASWKSIATQYGLVRLLMNDGVCYILNNGENIGVIDRSWQASFTADKNVFVGCVNNNGTKTMYFIGRLYRMRFGTTADFIPCKRDSDSKAGMYDIIRHTFYSSSGTDFGLPT